MPEAAFRTWEDGGWAVRVLVADPEDWPRWQRAAPVSVRDGGFTEVAPGTTTVLAEWPGV